MEVSGEELVRIEHMLVLADYDYVAFGESVGLMARQKHLKGLVGDSHGIVFCDFSGITECGIVSV